MYSSASSCSSSAISESARKSVAYPIETIRHSTAHLMAAAIKLLYPHVQFGVGPAINNGFYYDFKFPDGVVLKEEDFGRVEAQMKTLRKRKIPILRKEIPIDDAISFMELENQPYKVELLKLLKSKGNTSINKDLEDEITITEKNDGVSFVSMYSIGDIFTDLCKGPHVEHTGQTGILKLHNIAGSYWRGNSNNDVLQRIYALCYQNKEELLHEIQRLEEVRKRDHRSLGAKHKIFFFAPQEVGVGLPLWAPNGTIIRKELELLASEYERRYGYQSVSTPELAKESLYHKSGHLPYYKEDMYNPIDIEGTNYLLRPMNCPHHHMIYLNEKRSYRDLPLRLSEYGKVYRYELSGALTGLMRTRGFTQNDAHIYCRIDQAVDIFVEVMQLHVEYYKLFNITDYYLRLSLPDMDNLEKYVNKPEQWLTALSVIREALEKSGLPYKEVPGEAAFYGPKADFQITNAAGNEYTISTNQLDFLASERFNLVYQGEDGKEHPIYVIHRAPLGSHERFVAFLIEHYKAAFPTWLAPTQVQVLPISEKHTEYANTIVTYLSTANIHTGTGKGIRSALDSSDNTISKKIRNASQNKIPYTIIIGEKEIANRSISIRLRNGSTFETDVDSFVKRLRDEIENRLDITDKIEHIPSTIKEISFIDFLNNIPSCSQEHKSPVKSL